MEEDRKIDRLKTHLSKAIKEEYAVDLSDIGNTIGFVVGHYLHDKEIGDVNSLINGIKHGYSIMDGTHPKEK